MHYKVYKKQQKQVSLDNGSTWNDVVPAEYRKGDYIKDNTICSETEEVNQIHRWSADDKFEISTDNGISWTETGEERESSMDDAPDDVKRINGREEPKYPITVDYNERFKVLLPDDLSGSTYIALFIYDTPERNTYPIGQLGCSSDLHYNVNLTKSDFEWITTGGTATPPEDQFVDRALNFRCRKQGGITVYLTLSVMVAPYNQTRLLETNNVEILHNTRSVPERTLSSPSQTVNLRTTPDYNSYYLYQKQVKAPIALNWSWAWPFEYSASTEVAVENDKSCGYVEPEQPIYRWVDTSGIICDEVSDEPIYAWREADGFLCIGANKYATEVYSVSYNGGLTWSIVSPAEYRKGRIISSNADECNKTVEIYYRVSKSSLGSTFKVINELSDIQTAVVDFDYEIPIENGYIDTSWIPDDSTGFTLTFTIPSGYMQDELFSGIGFIQTATLRKGVTYIGNKVFYGTTLSDLNVYSDAPYLGDSALPNTINRITVNQGRKQWFDSAYHWSNYASKIVERI